MRRLLIFIAVLLLAACAERGPLDLEALSGKARGGDAAAFRELVSLLAVADNGVSGRAYAILVEIGEPAIPFLAERIAAADNEQREHVIAALGNLKVARAVPEIARVLADRKLGRRYIAAWALGQIGAPEGVPALVAALDDDDAEVRKHATRSLIKLNQAAVPALIDALPKASPRAEAGAVRALGDIADPRALEPLLARAEGPNRPEVILALGKLKDRRAESALIGGLVDPDWRVRMNAAMALGPVGGPACVAPLRRTLEDEVHVVREWSARSLEVVTGQHVKYRNDKGEYVLPYSIYH
jgi:HEAT repeat protein